jgi:arabinosyltransferase C
MQGSYRTGSQSPAELESAWYRLPPSNDATPLLVVSAAGRFDPDQVYIQWATGDGEPAGRVRLDHASVVVGYTDITAPGWRNLRAPMATIPPSATEIQLIATDDDLAPNYWIAVTPPRVPQLRTLEDVVGSSDPVLLDWMVGLAFPCQRPFDHDNGVIEVPKWRILPDRFSAEIHSSVMDTDGGGPLGITELLARATTVPSYLKNDWFRDWGSLQRLILYSAEAQPAGLDVGAPPPKPTLPKTTEGQPG